MALKLELTNGKISSPSPRDFGLLDVATYLSDGRIQEERGLGGKEILLFQLQRLREISVHPTVKPR